MTIKMRAHVTAKKSEFFWHNELWCARANLNPKQKSLYFFDYGDRWQFEVEFVKEGTSEKTHYPRIIDLRGESTQQMQITMKKNEISKQHS